MCQCLSVKSDVVFGTPHLGAISLGPVGLTNICIVEIKQAALSHTRILHELPQRPVATTVADILYMPFR